MTTVIVVTVICVYLCLRKIEEVCTKKEMRRLALMQQAHTNSYFDPSEVYHRNVPESNREHFKMIHRAFRNHTMTIQETDFSMHLYDKSDSGIIGCRTCTDIEMGVEKGDNHEPGNVECVLAPAHLSDDKRSSNMDILGGTVSLPVNEMALQVKSGGRKVPNTCTICLCDYEVNDQLVWSSNILCKHSFHAKCISTWFVRKKTPFCPICRRCFFDGTELEQAGFSCAETYKLPLSMHEFREISSG